MRSKEYTQHPLLKKVGRHGQGGCCVDFLKRSPLAWAGCIHWIFWPFKRQGPSLRGPGVAVRQSLSGNVGAGIPASRRIRASSPIKKTARIAITLLQCSGAPFMGKNGKWPLLSHGNGKGREKTGAISSGANARSGRNPRAGHF